MMIKHMTIAILLAAAGTAGAQEVLDTDMMTEGGAHAVARNSDDGGFIVVWAPKGGTTRPIRAKLFTKEGTSAGPSFDLDQTKIPAAAVTSVAVAYGDGQFLAVWRDERQAASVGSEIYGRIINKEGAFNGASFRVSDTGDKGPDAWPTAAFDGEKFIVAWAHRHIPPAGGGFTASFVENDDIRARFVKTDGSMTAASFAYSSEAVDSTKPSIASLGDRRSVSTWEDHPGPGKPGQVWGAGTDKDGKNGIVVPYAIGGGADQERPLLVANPATGRYLLVWKGSTSAKGHGIWYRKLADDGKYDGGKQELSAVTGRVGRVSITYEGSQNDLIIAWDTGEQGTATDLWFVRVDPVTMEAKSQNFNASPNAATRDWGVELVASGNKDIHGAYLRQSTEGGEVELIAGNLQMAPRHGEHESKCSASSTIAVAPVAARLLWMVLGVVVLQTVRRRRRREREER